MALIIDLKPSERVIIGNALVTNDTARTRLHIEGDAPILREKDIMREEEANSPCKKIYFIVQLMYLSTDPGKMHDLYFKQIHDGLPEWVQRPLDRSGLGSFDRAQARIAEGFRNSFRSIAAQALSIGRDAAAFLLAFGVGLYVTFFLLRDGETLASTLRDALPLERGVADRLLGKFVAVVRATVKGSVVVALVQGALGAITFWIVGVPAALLWGLLMALVALLPAVGPALVWVPVAIYLLATGAVWQGVVVVVSGVAVIGLADNILRPILVGRDTGIPDWLVLVTTLGGIEVAGLSGIVVGPLVAALFIAGWQILTEQREGRRVANPDAVDAPRPDGG